jgi:hypothetical protein
MIETAELVISLSLDDGEQKELDNLTYELQSEIEQLGVDAVNRVSEGEAPDGTKAVDWLSIGTFAVTLAPTIIPPLFELLKSWVDRKPSTPVKIKVKVGRKNAQIEYDPTKTSAKELESLLKSLAKSIK